MARVKVVAVGNVFGPLPAPEQMIHVLLSTTETRARLRAALGAIDQSTNGDASSHLYTQDEANAFVSASRRAEFSRGYAAAVMEWRHRLGVASLEEAAEVIAKGRG